MTTTAKPGQHTETPRSCSGSFADQIDQLILDERPSAKKLARLHEHLASCDSCRQRYDKVALAGRLLQGGPVSLGQPSAAEISRTRERLLGRTRLSPEPPVKRLSLRFVFALAMFNPVESVRIALLSAVEPELAALGPVGFWVANTLGPTATFLAGLLWPSLFGAAAFGLALRRFRRGDLV